MIISVIDAGTKVYVGFAVKNCGDFVKKVLGPVTINQTKCDYYQEASGRPNLKVTYLITSLGDCYVADRVFLTEEEAQKNAQEQYDKLVISWKNAQEQ